MTVKAFITTMVVSGEMRVPAETFSFATESLSEHALIYKKKKVGNVQDKKMKAKACILAEKGCNN